MIIKTWRDPYDAGFSPTKPKEIEIQPGLTVLVGCNGAGKTTLLRNIRSYCQENEIPCIHYNNLQDGGQNALRDVLFYGNYEEGSFLFNASEGESIKQNLGRKASGFSEFIQLGYVNDREHKLKLAFQSLPEDTVDIIECNDRVFLFDAVDSGLSVDSIIEVKDLFGLMIDQCKDTDKDVYIIIAANEYELARNSDCFDVNSGSYIRFNDYEDYRSFIIKSRQLKEKRLDKQEKWRIRKRELELAKYYKVKAKEDALIEEFKSKHDMNNLSWSQKHELDNITRLTRDFLRSARFISEKDIVSESL